MPYGQDIDDIAGDQDPETAAALLSEMLEVMRPKLHADAHVVFFCGVRQEARMREELEKATWLTPRSYLIWVKHNGQDLPEDDQDEAASIQQGQGDARRAFGPAHERALHATVGDPDLHPRPPDVLFAPRIPKRAHGHTTEKPVALLRQIIDATTTAGEVVADPFGGVASTLVAALRCQEPRRAWGSELEKKHYDEGEVRLQEAVSELQEADIMGMIAVPQAAYEMVLRPALSRSAEQDPELPPGAQPDWMLPPLDPIPGVPTTVWSWGEVPEDVLQEEFGG